MLVLNERLAAAYEDINRYRYTSLCFLITQRYCSCKACSHLPLWPQRAIAYLADGGGECARGASTVGHQPARPHPLAGRRSSVRQLLMLYLSLCLSVCLSVCLSAPVVAVLPFCFDRFVVVLFAVSGLLYIAAIMKHSSTSRTPRVSVTLHCASTQRDKYACARREPHRVWMLLVQWLCLP